MLRDLTSQKKIDPQVVVAAIESLKTKGWDINPNTVADEAKVPRSAVYRSPELMELVNQARGEPGREPTLADSSTRVLEIERMNAELEERIVALEAENQTLSRGRQDAWQEGYEAGLKEGRAEAMAESGRVETSAQFYAAPQASVAEEVEGAIEPQGEDGSAEVELAAPPADTQSAAEREVYVSPEWLANNQTALGSEDALPADSAHCEDVRVDNRAEDHVVASDFVDTQQYAGEEAVYVDEYSSEETSDQYSQSTYEYAGTDAGAADDGSTYAGGANAYGQATDQFGGLESTEDEWRSGMEDTRSGYGVADEASAGGEFDESVDDQSLIKNEQINEDELRDLLKYRFGRTSHDSLPEIEPEKKIAGSKFVGSARPTQEVPKRDFIVRQVPPDIRKACLVLGLRPEELTRETVHKAWKKEMANPGTHPDVGGDTEIAVYINTAKDTLMRWVDAQAPKLGKQFGKSGREPAKQDNKASSQKTDEQRDQHEPQ